MSAERGRWCAPRWGSGLLCTWLVLGGLPAAAAPPPIAVHPGDDLAAVLASARAGSVVRVHGGTHRGSFVVDRPLRLVGLGAPVLDGGGVGTVLRVTAPEVEVRGFVIRGSGSSLDREDAGIALEGVRGTIADNQLADVLFGIYLRQAAGSVLRNNRVAGKELALPRRGDGIRIWESDQTRLIGNQVRGARDVVLWYSRQLTVERNQVRKGRYGLHFMYCDDARIIGNELSEGSVGAFLMYSRRLWFAHNTVTGNVGPSGYGIGLKDLDDADVRENRFVGNRVGAFLDNSPRALTSVTRIAGNLFATNDVGLRLMPNVARATIRGNSFVENAEQVAIAGGGGDATANIWHGNHWSDYRGFDVDRDGRGDLPYRAERLFEQLVDRRPALRLFSGTPAAETLDLAARAFPLVRPQPKLVDETPLMAARLPAGTPLFPRRQGRTVAPLGLLLLLAAVAPLAPGLWSRRRALLTRSTGVPREASAGRVGGRPAAAALPMIAVHRLGKCFGDRAALAEVSFTIHAGEVVALWGANGAGKTTALRALLGVMPYEGEVRVAGHDSWRQGKRARQAIGFVPQETAFPDLTVGETLELFARLRRVPPQRPARLLDELGLGGDRAQPVQSLSGGRKQRLALAVALLADPPLLLLDEPTANLDLEARATLIDRLRALGDEGKTIVFSSHRPEEVRALAQRVLVLSAGRLVGDGPPGLLLAGGPAATLALRVAPEELAVARRWLALAGYTARSRGGELWVEVAADRKGEPITHLVRRGVAVADLRLEGGR